jgi:hypothetical protein
MKTVKQIEAETDELRNKLRRAVSGTAALNGKLAFLKQCKYYLEAAPRPEFLQAQYSAVTKRLKLLDERFQSWRAGRTGDLDDHKRQYRAEFDIPKLKAQAKALKWLLDLN